MNIDFDTIHDIIKSFPNEDICLSHLEKLRWNGTIVSPFDPISKVYHCKNNYRCRNSGKYFNAKTGTIFYNSKIALQKWFIAIWIVTKKQPEISSTDLAMILQITQKSAWYMLKRIKNYFEIESERNTVRNSGVRKKHQIPEKIADMEVITEENKFQMSQWLKFLKNK